MAEGGHFFLVGVRCGVRDVEQLGGFVWDEGSLAHINPRFIRDTSNICCAASCNPSFRDVLRLTTE